MEDIDPDTAHRGIRRNHVRHYTKTLALIKSLALEHKVNWRQREFKQFMKEHKDNKTVNDINHAMFINSKEKELKAEMCANQAPQSQL